MAMTMKLGPRRVLAATSVSLIALCLGSAAFAQDAAQMTPQTEQPDNQQGEASDRATEPATSDDILVTATKRSESLSKVPISITAFSQENMDSRGIRDIRDVVAQTPGLDISRGAGGSGSQTRFIIRGIDSNAGAATSAIYIDDTPIQTRNSSLNYNGTTVPFIFDVERVEVLRGPQGTLFGASAQGGAVRFITPTPSLTRYSAYGRAAVNVVDGGGTGYEAGVAIGGPIVNDVLGFRASVYHRYNAGWIDRQSWLDPTDRSENTNSDKTFVARGSLLFRPTDWLSIAPSVSYQELKFHDRADLWTRCPATTGSPGSTGTLNPCPLGVSDPQNGKFLSYSPIAQPSTDRFVLPSLKVVGEWGSTSVTSVTSLFRRHVTDLNDATYINARNYFGNAYLFPITPTVPRTIGTQNPDTHQRLFAQELRISGGESDALIRYTAGLYFSRSSVETSLPITLPTYSALYLYRFGRTPEQAGIPPRVGDAIYFGNEYTTEQEIAAFANIDVRVSSRLTATIGGRYSRNKLDFDVTERGVSYPPLGIAKFQGQQRSQPFLPKASLSFQATRDTLYYATYSEGFRTGGVNRALPDVCQAEAEQLGLNARDFSPDKTKSYEVGSKGRVLGGTLSYEASAYYVKWQNIQQQLRLQCLFALVQNTAEATSKGFDLNLTMRPSRSLTVGFGVGYVDAKYDQTVLIGTAPQVLADQTLGATPWTINSNVEYRFDVGSNEAFVRAQYNLKSANKGLFLFQERTATTYDPTRVYADDFQSLDLRAGVDVGQMNVSVYAENVLNDNGYFVNAPTYVRGPLWRGAAARPRTIGLQLIARY
jgi:outer membrane receptor protein involved in Fe transport